MEETIEQYKHRILGYVEKSQPMEVLETTVGKVEKLLNGVATERIQAKEEGKWSAAEILTHYAEGEIVFSYRLRMILSQNKVDIQAYDQNVWMNNAGYLKVRPELALALFRQLRKTNIEMLHSLSAAQWDNYGIHSERGKESVHDLVRIYAGHDLNHLKQMEKILS